MPLNPFPLTTERITLPMLHQGQGTNLKWLLGMSVCASEPGATHVVDGRRLEWSVVYAAMDRARGTPAQHTTGRVASVRKCVDSIYLV